MKHIPWSLNRYGLIVAAWLGAVALHAGEPADKPPVSLEGLPAPERVEVPRISGSVNINGKLDDTVWAEAAVLTPFFRNDGSGVGREPTIVRIMYDKTALYLGWTCRDSDIQATMTERDSRFWEEEVVEFFVTPDVLSRYFELQWNPLGGVFDATIVNTLNAQGISEKFVGDWDFTAAGMTSAVYCEGTIGDASDTDRYWQVEVRVPFSAFDHAPPRPDEIWRANFYRFNRGKGQETELLSWSPTRLPGGFHQPNRFGFLVFGDQ